MRTKRLVAALLCLVLACFTLAGCEEIIGDFEYDDWEPEVTVKLQFDLYIIGEDVAEDAAEDTLKAQRTVQSKINQHLDEKFNTTLEIKYIAEKDYEEAISKIKENVNTEKRTVKNATDRQYGGAIVLIKGKDMHDSLVESDALVDLSSFLAGTAHGKLKSQITRNLLTAATITDEDGAQHLYCIPNDHVVGEYQYTIIKRDVAEGILNFSAQSELKEMNSVDGEWNDKAKELIASIETNLPDMQIKDVIDVVTGAYEDKAAWESKGYICNVSKYPEVTAAEALMASFGIIKTGDIYVGDEPLIEEDAIYSRAMDIIYSINADTTVRNLLQYGVENTHYRLSEVDGYTYAEILENSDYHMNLLYTGDIFNAYYCKDVWTHEMASNGENQNKESTLPK